MHVTHLKADLVSFRLTPFGCISVAWSVHRAVDGVTFNTGLYCGISFCVLADPVLDLVLES